MKRKLLVLTTALIALAPAALAATADMPPMPGKWHTLKHGKITLLYQDDTKDIAYQVARLAAEKLQAEFTPPSQEDLKRLVRKRKEVLAFITSELGLTEPPECLGEVFDGVSAFALKGTWRGLYPSRMRLWRRETLKQLLKKGTSVPGFTYDAAKDGISYHFSTGQDKDGPTVADGGFLAVVVRKDSPKTALQQIAEGIDRYLDMARSIVMGPGAVCHEAVEASLYAVVGVPEPFSRWFAEGAANVIAERCVRKFVSAKASDEFASECGEIGKYSSDKDLIDLASWRAVSWEDEMPPADDDLRLACYAFATHEVRQLAARHDPGALSAICKEISKRKGSKETTVVDAVSAATGEDMQSVLAAYGKKCADPFRGIAVDGFRIGSYAKDAKGERQMTPLPEGDTYKVRGEDGVSMQVGYVLLYPPVMMRAELVGHSDTGKQVWKHVEKTELTSTTLTGRQLGFYDKTSKMPAGNYRLSVSFNDHLLKEFRVKVVD